MKIKALAIGVAAALPLSAMASLYEVASDDGDYTMKVGGRIHLDYNRYDGVINKSEFDTDEEWFFRRTRLEFNGKAKDFIYHFSVDYDDINDSWNKDYVNKAFVTYTGWGEKTQLTVGQQNEFFGLQDIISSKWITGIERAMPANFETEDNRAVKFHGSTDALTYSLVYVYDENINKDNDVLDHAVTGRFVVRPIMTEDKLLHLGAGFSKRKGEFEKLEARLGVRGGEDGLANRVGAKYNEGIADELEIWNLEAAASLGSVHLMAEYFDGKLFGKDGNPDVDADGYYFQAGWIITGEQRSYKTGIGAFDKITPAGEMGAVEVFARYDGLDFSSNENDPMLSVSAGDANTLVYGVNWYVNKNVKLSLNFIDAEVDNPINTKDNGEAVAGRVQVVF